MEKGEAGAADGTRLAFRLWDGPAGRAAVVLLHSLALHAGMRAGVAPALDGRARLVAPDARGHGGSGRAAGPDTGEAMADDVAAVLHTLGWARALVVGCSMGGCVAQQAAAPAIARVPERAT
jgi:3-oxoadipate enol-lactonase